MPEHSRLSGCSAAAVLVRLGSRPEQSYEEYISKNLPRTCKTILESILQESFKISQDHMRNT